MTSRPPGPRPAWLILAYRLPAYLLYMLIALIAVIATVSALA